MKFQFDDFTVGTVPGPGEYFRIIDHGSSGPQFHEDGTDRLHRFRTRMDAYLQPIHTDTPQEKRGPDAREDNG